MTTSPRYYSTKECQALNEEFKKRALRQLLNRWSRIRSVETPLKLWGDEIEYTLLRFDDDTRQVFALLKSDEVRKELDSTYSTNVAEWTPEACAFQLESCPTAPYGSTLDSIQSLANSVHQRQMEARQTLNLQRGEEILALSAFPLNCAPNYTDPPPADDKEPIVFPHRSAFFTSSTLTQHPVFLAVVGGNAQRRSGQVARIHAPLFIDTETRRPFLEDLTPYDTANASTRAALDETRSRLLPDSILVDTAGLGVSVCSMQITQQLRNLSEACYVFDQLAVVAAPMLALTAAAPIVRGMLADWDSRWPLFCYSWETRSDDELSSIGLTRIHSLVTYASEDAGAFNDVPITVDEEFLQGLRGDIEEEHFAKYVAHFFTHEPIVLTDVDWKEERDDSFGLFTTVQDFTNWSIARLKFPIIGDDGGVKAGWRVEFRPMGLQMTSFENAAFVAFIRLLTLATLHFFKPTAVNWLVPISKLEENVIRSFARGASRNALFNWRRLPTIDTAEKAAIEYCQLSVCDIFLGCDEFFGLIPLVRRYLLETCQTSSESTAQLIHSYIDYVEAKANGSLPTVAEWMRAFVHSHPDYKHDSIVPRNVVYDLLKKYAEVANRELVTVGNSSRRTEKMLNSLTVEMKLT